MDADRPGQPMTTERWKDIPGYEGYYQASTLGNVRSIDRTIITRNGHRKTLKGQLLVQNQLKKHNPPYYLVSLTKNGRHVTKLVHQLILATWLGPCPTGCESRHGPIGFADNSIVNLCYGTHSDNEKDKDRDGTADRTTNECGVKRSDGVEFVNMEEAAKQSGTFNTNICAVCNGRRGSAGGYGWVRITGEPGVNQGGKSGAKQNPEFVGALDNFNTDLAGLLSAPGAKRSPEFSGALSNIDWEHEPENVALDFSLRLLADAAQLTGSTFNPQAPKTH